MYQDIQSNKRKSYILIFCFCAFVIGVAMVFGHVLDGDPLIFLIPAVLFSIISSFTGYYYSDKLVLSISGAKEIQEKDNPELYHLLENLCITVGLKKVPRLYLIQDPAPNAFATGRDPDHAVIAVTSGLLSRLKKAEIEGVLAHELAHVLNYDIRLATLVVVFVGVVALMSDLFIRSTLYGGRSRRNAKGNAGVILLVIGIVLAILSPLVAKIIQLAVSRKREYLADAKAALITRYPEGLASALEKIAADSHPLKKMNKATAHMYIYCPLTDEKSSFLNNLFSTHPPVNERIKKLRKMGV